MKAKIKTIVAILGLIMITSASVPTVASAASSLNACTGDGNFFLPTWYKGLCESDGKTIASPVTGASGSTTDGTKNALTTWVSKLALNIVQILLTVVGYVSLGYIIYGGFMYMTQGDSSSGTASARKTIQNAVIGLVLSIMSVAIVSFIANRL